MVNSPAKSNNLESPKTPGGISRSLLTPCRRPGLSRNWKKSGSSPFISPLVGSSNSSQQKENIKRKECVLGEDCDIALESTTIVNFNNNDADDKNVDSLSTPSRSLKLPRRKKSKTVLSDINEAQDNTDLKILVQNSTPAYHNTDTALQRGNYEELENNINDQNAAVLTPVRTRSKKSIPLKSNIKPKTNVKEDVDTTNTIKKNINQKHIKEVAENNSSLNEAGDYSPSDLKKNCIVVLQKQIFKNVALEKETNNKNKVVMTHPVFDSDSDDIPLNIISKENSNDLVQNSELEPKGNSTKPQTYSLKPNSRKTKNTLAIFKPKLNINIKESFNDDDDFDTKKTILIRKAYDKVSKPSKSKSTGSITQKDIDELKARIETKQKLLLAHAMTEETKELRDLIKKWQKGCQDALMELMNLMKSKFPDKANMDYAEILETLKIPAALVGYDSEEDCFITPDDTNIIVGNL